MKKQMIRLDEIIKNDAFLSENEEKAVAVLRALSQSITNIDSNMLEIVPRVAFKTRTSNDFVKKVIKSMPGSNIDEAIKLRHSQILILFKKFVSIKMNKNLDKYFTSKEFQIKKDLVNSDLDSSTPKIDLLSTYFASPEFAAHKEMVNSK
jgi:hypothetical protein